MLPEKGGSADAGDGALPLSQKGADAKRIAHFPPANVWLAKSHTDIFQKSAILTFLVTLMKAGTCNILSVPRFNLHPKKWQLNVQK